MLRVSGSKPPGLRIRNDLTSLDGSPKGFREVSSHGEQTIYQVNFGRTSNDIKCISDNGASAREIPIESRTVRVLFPNGSKVSYRYEPDPTLGVISRFVPKRIIYLLEDSANTNGSVQIKLTEPDAVQDNGQIEHVEPGNVKAFEIECGLNYYIFVLAFSDGRVIKRRSDTPLLNTARARTRETVNPDPADTNGALHIFITSLGNTTYYATLRGENRVARDLECHIEGSGNEPINIPVNIDNLEKIFPAGADVKYKLEGGGKEFQKTKVKSYGTEPSRNGSQTLAYLALSECRPFYYKQITGDQRLHARLYLFQSTGEPKRFVWALVSPRGKVLLRETNEMISLPNPPRELRGRTQAPVSFRELDPLNNIAVAPHALPQIKVPDGAEIANFAARFKLGTLFQDGPATENIVAVPLGTSGQLRDLVAENMAGAETFDAVRKLPAGSDTTPAITTEPISLLLTEKNIQTVFKSTKQARFKPARDSLFEDVKIVGCGSLPVDSKPQLIENFVVVNKGNTDKETIFYRKCNPRRKKYWPYATFSLVKSSGNTNGNECFSYILKVNETGAELVLDSPEEILLPHIEISEDTSLLTSCILPGRSELQIVEELEPVRENVSAIFRNGREAGYRPGAYSDFRDVTIVDNIREPHGQTVNDHILLSRSAQGDLVSQDIKLTYRTRSKPAHVKGLYIIEKLGEGSCEYALVFRDGRILGFHTNKRIELPQAGKSLTRRDLTLNPEDFVSVFGQNTPIFYRGQGSLKVLERVKVTSHDLSSPTSGVTITCQKERGDRRYTLNSTKSDFYCVKQPRAGKHVYLLRLDNGILLARVSDKEIIK